MGSLHAQIVHTMWAEEHWLARIQARPRTNWTIETYPTLSTIREQWLEVEANWRTYLAALTEKDIVTTFTYTRFAGEKTSNVVHEILRHVVNHGTDHRSQMLRIIHDYGGETFEQDMFFYYRERDGNDKTAT
jgi:uncharacterized damage-inducible protein DinB